MTTAVVNKPDISITQLEEVFATFNKVSADLGSSYRELESRVSGLSEELAATQSARIKELTEKEQLASKLSVLMASLPGGVITLDEKGIIKEENPVAKKILGKSYQNDSWAHALESSASLSSIMDGEVSFKDGKRISISSNHYGDNGEIIILLTDVSENYRLNTLINREQRLSALGEMAAKLAHQVRTPLSSAILYLSHIPSSGITEKILDRLRQIEKLVDGMLSYIRGGTDSNQEFSLNTIITELNEAFTLQLKKVDGRLHISLPQQDCRISGNKEAIYNAISNLIENAIQAVPNKVEIKLDLEQEGDHFQIYIEDNGTGIKGNIKEKVFDPFFSTRPMGTGLGLAVVMSVIKSHKGDISISNAKTGGTVFTLSLPDNLLSTQENSSIWSSQNEFNNVKKAG